MPEMGKIWEVVSTATVKEGPAPDAKELGRLTKGALLQQLAPLEGGRAAGECLRFERIYGSGPESGWVTTRQGARDFAVRTYDVSQAYLERLTRSRKPRAKRAPGEREYDITVYGATGFTGALMVEHLDALLSRSPTKHKWALAGRNQVKLEDLAKRCKTSPGIEIAGSPEELQDVVGNCKVLVAAAGPYQTCGEDAVRACVEEGTHYVDVTGETVWVHDMIEKYHQQAKAKGVMVIHCAAQVCAVDELNCYMLAKKLGPLKQFREYFFQYGGSTGGTNLTNITTMANMTEEKLKVDNDPFALGGRRACGVRPSDADVTQAEQDPLFPSLWLAPAYNTKTGSRIIRRTCQLFEESPADQMQYGSNFSVVIRDGALAQRAAQGMVAQLMPVPSVDVAKAGASMMQQQAASGQAPKPGQGPPAKTRLMYYSEVFAVAEGENGSWAHVHYTGPEAYEVTAMCCVTAALTLTEEGDRIRPKERGGVLTPAFALHNTTYAERLQACAFAFGAGRKMTFDIAAGKPNEEDVKRAIQAKSKNAALGQAEIMEGKLKAFA